MRSNQSVERWRSEAFEKPLPPRQSGTGLKLDVHGTQTMGRRLGLAAPFTALRAHSAPSRFSRHFLTQRYAATLATPRSVVGPESMTSSARAPSALSSFEPTSTESSSFALDRVTRVTPTGCVARVYNLSVSGQPEYFANGVLSHNCDSLLYAWRAALAFLEPDAPKPVPEVDKWQRLAREKAFKPRDEEWDG